MRIWRPAFTLIELLVVVAIIAALLSILLPVLSRAKKATHGAVCRSNLRQLQMGWQTYMQSNEYMIPYTRSIFRHPNWADALDEIFPDAPAVSGTGELSFGACPAVQTSHDDMYYRLTRWGYAVNTWWSNAPPSHNELKSWQHIRNPSQYPWFIDPQVYDVSPDHFGAHRVPWEYLGPPDWGVGANHDDGRIANVSFADGSVLNVPIEDVRRELPSQDNYPWLENR